VTGQYQRVADFLPPHNNEMSGPTKEARILIAIETLRTN
jgi:hypothetical protein